MSIGKKIRELRRAKDLTQEELASVLSVSVSAVSQWESEKTAPDLSLLPFLCRYFHVTSDELLGIDISRREEEIEALCTDIHMKYARPGKHKEAYQAYKDALSCYPDSYRLMYCVAVAASLLMRSGDVAAEETKRLCEEEGRLYKKIVAACTDGGIRSDAAAGLARWYAANGEKEKAEESLRNLPHMNGCREFTRVLCAPSRAERQKCQKDLLFELLQHFLNQTVMNSGTEGGEPFYRVDEMALLHEKRIALLRILFEEGDYGFFNTHLCDSLMATASYAAKQGQHGEALQALAHAKKAAVDFLDFMERGAISHTSLLLRGHKSDATLAEYDPDNNHVTALLAQMQEPIFDCVRSAQTFKEIENELTDRSPRSTQNV